MDTLSVFYFPTIDNKKKKLETIDIHLWEQDRLDRTSKKE